MATAKKVVKKVAKKVAKKGMTTGELKAFQQKGFKKPDGFKGATK